MYVPAEPNKCMIVASANQPHGVQIIYTAACMRLLRIL
jgi:hypothetical protein